MEKVIIIYTQFYDFKGIEEKIGGIETYIKNLIDVFENQNKEVVIIQYADNDFKKKYNNTVVYGIKNEKKKNSKVLLKKAYEIGDCKKDVLLFASSHMNCKNKFLKSLAIQHGIYWDVETVKGRKFNKTISTFLKSLQIFLEIKRNSMVNKTVCVDYNYINWYRALTILKNEKINCIPNFTDIPYNYIEKNNEIPKIIFARRFEKIRGIDNISNVIDRLNEENIKFEITFAGSGSNEKVLKEKFKNVKNVDFITYKPEESIDVHSKYDIAVVPSIGSEGTSLSLLEAMSASCSVLATNVGGMTNILIDQYNGILCETNEESLYLGLKKLILDKKLRIKLSKQGFDSVKNGFNIGIWKEKWANIINE
ncbi:MAG: glycosyltransferase family 4 protein [Bacilli bacterium]